MNIGIIVITHGKFAEELVNTAFSICGTKDAVESISVVSEITLESLCESIKHKIDQMNTQYVVILLDMLGGTPCNASLMVCKQYDDKIHIISGVNLYMLITAITLRQQVGSIEEFVSKLISAGKNSIADVKEKFIKKLKSNS